MWQGLFFIYIFKDGSFFAHLNQQYTALIIANSDIFFLLILITYCWSFYIKNKSCFILQRSTLVCSFT